MGKGGRIACIFLPYLFSIGTLVCLILVGLGSTKTSHPLSDIYFLRADLHDIEPDPRGLDNKYFGVGEGLQQAVAAGALEDFYTIGLWNHCSGDYVDGEFKVKECTERQSKYWFNPIEVWGLDKAEDLLPKELKDGIRAYEKAVGWLFIAYVVAFATTLLQLIVGISAIFSRWGSFATTIVAHVSGFFTIAASATATALYVIMMGAIAGGLKPFNIKAQLGKDMFVLTWFATLFALAGSMFWLFSVCCCSGRSPYSHDKRGRNGVVAEKTPYTYERVQSPFGGAAYGDGQAVPLNNMSAQRDTAYEPYRHEPARD